MNNFFKKLFGIDRQNSKNTSEAPVRTDTDQDTLPRAKSTVSQKTQPLAESDMDLPDTQMQSIQIDLPQFEAACGQSVGMQRDHNEDGMFNLSSLLLCDSIQIPLGLYLVADGMGGHEYGEVASGIAIRAFVSYVLKKLFTPLINLNSDPPDESLQEIMEQGVYEAHKAIIKEAIAREILRGGQVYYLHPASKFRI